MLPMSIDFISWNYDTLICNSRTKTIYRGWNLKKSLKRKGKDEEWHKWVWILKCHDEVENGQKIMLLVSCGTHPCT